MNGKDLLEKINSIDNNLIEEAYNINKKRMVYNKWYVIVASLCIVILGTLLFRNQEIGKNSENEKEIVFNEEIKNSSVYECSKQEDYAEEFVGTAIGDVYTVNGYNENFRIFY